MKIKKLGHCCFVVEVNNKKVLTDPGSYSYLQFEEKDVDLIVITHEHPDHFHLESLKKVLAINPNVTIVTNTAVGRLLNKAGIKYKILEDKNSGEFAGVYLEAHGNQHAFIRSGVAVVQNTGYFLGEKLFYPGDAFIDPKKPVDILALPVAAPWLTIENVLQYAKSINPRVAFPVHDGMMNELGLAYLVKTVPMVLESFGIESKILELGKKEDL